jgi:hypothetical protein
MLEHPVTLETEECPAPKSPSGSQSSIETAASTRRGGVPGGSMRPEPGALPDIVPYEVPFILLIEVIRGIALTGDGITAYGQQVVVSVA